jgi:hypothetical protein
VGLYVRSGDVAELEGEVMRRCGWPPRDVDQHAAGADGTGAAAGLDEEPAAIDGDCAAGLM